MDYIEATVQLLVKSSGLCLDYNIDRLYIKENIDDYQPTEFVPKGVDNKTEHPTDIIVGDPKLFNPTFVSQEFEKDDDTNWHINWINAASNIRAMNYSIPIVDRQETKGIAGKIIPAIATTTSAVAGLAILEMLKYLLDYNKTELYRSTFINLAEPLLVYSEPIEAPMIDVGGTKLNAWVKFEYKKDSTLSVFKQHYENVFNTQISMIVIDTSMVYADFLGTEILDKKLSEIIKEQFETVPVNVTFTLATDDDKDIPPIIVNVQ
jgi:hypothetical protein